jgi:hypothetical protein
MRLAQIGEQPWQAGKCCTLPLQTDNAPMTYSLAPSATAVALVAAACAVVNTLINLYNFFHH